jgi:FkbM family methyltransferase
MSSFAERTRRIVRGILPKRLYSLLASALDGWCGIRRLGFTAYTKLAAAARRPAGGTWSSLRLRSLPHPIYIRPGTPDAHVVLQSFAREAYGYILPPAPVRLIVDAGANIGDTSLWYATRFPDAKIVAVEPDPDNLAVLSRNCAPYGDRIRILRAALWPVPDRSLAMAGAYTGARVWEVESELDSACPSIDPLTILRNSGEKWIDIFKIDIEGAEQSLFSGPCDEWLERTCSLAVEVHSREALEAVMAATIRNGFRHAQFRGLYFFWR